MTKSKQNNLTSFDQCNGTQSMTAYWRTLLGAFAKIATASLLI